MKKRLITTTIFGHSMMLVELLEHLKVNISMPNYKDSQFKLTKNGMGSGALSFGGKISKQTGDLIGAFTAGWMKCHDWQKSALCRKNERRASLLMILAMKEIAKATKKRRGKEIVSDIMKASEIALGKPSGTMLEAKL